MPHSRVLRSQTIHRLASGGENTKGFAACNRQHPINSIYVYASFRFVAETTHTAPRMDKSFYNTLRFLLRIR
ncbi:hypothetical protein CFBP5875_03825 [Agrobacterium pusense]|nr:hypothetical protein [Agrobacterium pusense]QCL85663.1 hypothetical protein CFBP5875_03825 [Agrobacterium pusense]QSZ58357.1 hypothetical protein BTN45_03645 [Rhizobium sp. ZX09]RSC38849.1 hypothetical protein EGT36_11855 [Agrobacterium sp. FDAARGOS_525]HAU75731.1 hypothetical protein [Agrobacterium sp.]